MGTSDPTVLRARQAQRTAEALLTSIAADASSAAVDAARAREASEALRQELMPDPLPTPEPEPAQTPEE